MGKASLPTELRKDTKIQEKKRMQKIKPYPSQPLPNPQNKKHHPLPVLPKGGRHPVVGASALACNAENWVVGGVGCMLGLWAFGPLGLWTFGLLTFDSEQPVLLLYEGL